MRVPLTLGWLLQEQTLMKAHVFLHVQWLADSCKYIIRDWANQPIGYNQGQPGMDRDKFEELVPNICSMLHRD